MFVKTIISLCCFLFLCDAAFEGDTCFKDGSEGVCRNIKFCNAAIEDRKFGRFPKICGFIKSEPIVCCLDNTNKPITPRPTARPTPAPERADDDEPVYVDLKDKKEGQAGDKCGKIPARTAAKTGRLAFDKCIEYQEKYIYPCERSGSLFGKLGRGNHCHHNADELVVGGNITSKHEFPHMVMLGYGSDPVIQWGCGGSIISERFVLTAGHCTGDANRRSVSFVLAGAYTRSDANVKTFRYAVRKIIPHQRYKSPIKYDDIALIQTDPIKLSQFIVPACLHLGDNVNDDRVLATGWGLTNETESNSEIMLKVKLEKSSPQDCANFYRELRLLPNGVNHETQICYGAPEGESRDTCQGDSGGPIQVKSVPIHCMYVVVGVTSFGKGCGKIGGSAIYTKVAPYVPWIESVVWRNG